MICFPLVLIFGLSAIGLDVLASAKIINVAITIPVNSATDFQQDLTQPIGKTECKMIWVPSTSPGISNQELTIEGLGIGVATYNLAPEISSIIIPGVIIEEFYIVSHVSEINGLYSSTIFTSCTPAPARDAPVMKAADSVQGTSNMVFFNNGLLADEADLKCRVTASLVNLSGDPYGDPGNDLESVWVDCNLASGDPLSDFNYSYTFSGLTVGQTYFYHTQSSSDPAPGALSAFSNVVSAAQLSPPVGGGGASPPPPPPEEVVEEEEEEIPEEVAVEFILKAKPEYRVAMASHPNLGLNAVLAFFKPSINSLTSGNMVLDDFGNGTLDVVMYSGVYDIGIKGEAHNTKVLRNIEILSDTKSVTLDFTLGDTWELTAGDTVDDNTINALDMAKLIANYRAPGGVNDLNKIGGVNALDIAILVWNYRKAGDPLAAPPTNNLVSFLDRT